MKNIKSIFKLLVLIGVVFLAEKAFATAPPPSPTCKIEGEIISSVFKEAYENPCLAEGSCPTDTPLQFPARQEIKIKVSKVSYVGGNESVVKCEDMYQIGSTSDFWILKEGIVNGDKFTSGKLITASVNGGRSAYISTYTLKSKENTTTVTTVTTENTSTTNSNIIESSKISEKIIADKTADSVQSVTLSGDKKTYTVEAIKTGKLFTLVDVDVDFKITIDATTGKVSEINKPWWSFLVNF